MLHELVGSALQMKCGGSDLGYQNGGGMYANFWCGKCTMGEGVTGESERGVSSKGQGQEQ